VARAAHTLPALAPLAAGVSARQELLRCFYACEDDVSAGARRSQPASSAPSNRPRKVSGSVVAVLQDEGLGERPRSSPSL
jgi:hypothetical protein